MRHFIVGLAVVIACFIGHGMVAQAQEQRDSGDELLGGVLSGLLGGQTADTSAQERERLVQLLQGGEYATSRQGEVVDAFVAGVPLTHRDHVYSAKPVSPSQTTVPRSGR